MSIGMNMIQDGEDMVEQSPRSVKKRKTSMVKGDNQEF